MGNALDYEERMDHPRKCTARRHDGEPCGKFAAQGAYVCNMHGGAAPQVLAKARERLVMAADRMAAALLGMAEDSSSEAVKLNAIRDALDRAGITSKQEVSLELKPWEQLMQGLSGIATISREEHLANQGRAIIDVDEVEPDTEPDSQPLPSDGQPEPPPPLPSDHPDTSQQGDQLMTMEEAAVDSRPYVPRWRR